MIYRHLVLITPEGDGHRLRLIEAHGKRAIVSVLVDHDADVRCAVMKLLGEDEESPSPQPVEVR